MPRRVSLSIWADGSAWSVECDIDPTHQNHIAGRCLVPGCIGRVHRVRWRRDPHPHQDGAPTR